MPSVIRKNTAPINIILIRDNLNKKRTYSQIHTEGSSYFQNYEIARGIKLSKKTINLGNTSRSVIISDTGAQEKFKYISTKKYEGCSGVIIIYTDVDPKSLRYAVSTIPKAQLNSPGGTPIFLVKDSDVKENEDLQNQGAKIAEKYQVTFLQLSFRNQEHVKIMYDTLYNVLETELKRATLAASTLKVLHIPVVIVEFITSYVHRSDITPILE